MSFFRYRIALLALVGVLLTGCVNYEGVGFKRMSYINEGMQKYGRLEGETDYGDTAKEAAERSDVSEAIAIGTVTVFREYEGDDYEKAYTRYVENFEDWGVARGPSVSLEQFKDRYAGWSRIKGFHIPLVGAAYIPVLVHRSVVGEIEFESGVSTVLLATSSDLVATISNEDGAFVLAKMLCRDTKGYHACKDQYHRGIFDAATGRELDGKGKFKEDGYRIDLTTYKVIETAQ